MLKIMIVDDMPVFREFLRTSIDWNSYGFEICCEAKNGKEALKLAEQHEPDVVLSDITMPYLDGLELSEALASEYPDMAVVLITGNSEFEYARKAVKLGVADYIVKPFEKEELLITLLNLQDNINRAQEAREEQNNIEQERNAYNLRQLIYKEKITTEDLNSIQNQLEFDLKGDHYVVLALEIDADMKKPESSEITMNWKDSVSEMLKTSSESVGQQFYFNDFEGRVISLTSYHSAGRQNVKTTEILDADELEDFIQLVQSRLGYNLSIGIGTVCTSIGEVRKSYLQAVYALNNRYELGHNKVILYENISENLKAFGFYSVEVNENILRFLQQSDKGQTLSVIRGVFEDVNYETFSSGYKHMMYMGFISLLLSYIVKSGKNVTDIFTGSFRPNEILSVNASDKVQRDFILDSYSTVIDYMLENKDSRASIIASKAKKIIDQSLGQTTFNIQALSKQLLVNQTYLRKMFKSEMGMTISDYMKKARMEKSKELIMTTDYKLSYIAEVTGYSDSGYFSKCFKQYFGKSPSQFRDQ